MQSQTNYNLTQLYDYIDGREPRGIIWSKSVLEGIEKLLKEINSLNELQTLKQIAKSKSGSADIYIAPHPNIELEELEEKIQKLEAEFGLFPGSTYYVRTLSGDTKSVEIPTVKPLEHLLLQISGIVELSDNFKLTTESSNLPLCKITTLEISKHSRNYECYHSNPPYTFWKNSWNRGIWHNENKIWDQVVEDGQIKMTWRETSTIIDSKKLEEREETAQKWYTFCTRLKQMIMRNATALATVDKVVCFGLGSLSLAHNASKSFVQHAAARTIADTLKEQTGRDIPVLAQDPAYCLTCQSVLKEELDIEAVADFSGFYNLTPNSFVFICSPTNPLREIVVDILVDKYGENVRGPKAMLCDRIEADAMRPESDITGRYTDDFPTKRLVKWRNECEETYYGDAVDWLNTSYDEWEKRYPKASARMPEETEEQKNVKAETAKANHQKMKVIYKDLYLYV